MSSDLEPEVKTAAEFLNDLYQKGYKDADLRKYLVQTRGLSVRQVDAAFEIHRARISQNVNSPGRPDRIPRKSTEERKNNEDADRPEKVTTDAIKLKDDAMFFLLPNKRVAGLELLKDFLTTERNYCVILDCLKDDYHKTLAQLADQKRFLMTRKEVDEVFRRIPDLLRFHQTFYSDMKEGVNIGRKFVRLLHFFKGYAEYMKDCTLTIQKMRQYTRDKRLIKCLRQIKITSSRKKDDMVDLLLVPLDRITDYKDFLNTLYGWADKTHKIDYEFLGKASRRIGRIANYIDQYKYGISNRNEMNKVQCFLGKQCDILIPTRRIVRRGMIIRRTTGWMGRNKHYIFFLFNDVLLWTTRRGELQNVVQLRKCSIFNSDSKTNHNKKFKIVVDRQGQKQKVLLLECEYKRQRDEWYAALETGIKDSKEIIQQAWWDRGETAALDVDQNSDEDQELSKPIPAINKVNWKEQQENNSPISEEPRHTPDESYDERYEDSFNYAHQEFKEIDAMDETASQISEYDKEFFDQHKQYNDGSMSPFRKSMFSQNAQHVSRESFSNNDENYEPDSDKPHRVVKSSIIRRTKKPSSETSTLEDKSGVKISLGYGRFSEESENNLKRTSSFKIRLNDFEK